LLSPDCWVANHVLLLVITWRFVNLNLPEERLG